jgi:hypothetical protein
MLSKTPPPSLTSIQLAARFFNVNSEDHLKILKISSGDRIKFSYDLDHFAQEGIPAQLPVLSGKPPMQIFNGTLKIR